METTIKHAQSELLELAIKLRTDMPRYDLEELPYTCTRTLIGAAIIDEPSRLMEFMSYLNEDYLGRLGRMIFNGYNDGLIGVLVQQIKDLPYFRDILRDVQAKADEAIEEERLARLTPEETIIDRMVDTVSFK